MRGLLILAALILLALLMGNINDIKSYLWPQAIVRGPVLQSFTFPILPYEPPLVAPAVVTHPDVTVSWPPAPMTISPAKLPEILPPQAAVQWPKSEPPLVGWPPAYRGVPLPAPAPKNKGSKPSPKKKPAVAHPRMAPDEGPPLPYTCAKIRWAVVSLSVKRVARLPAKQQEQIKVCRNGR